MCGIRLVVDLAIGFVSVWLGFGYYFAEAPEGLTLEVVSKYPPAGGGEWGIQARGPGPNAASGPGLRDIPHSALPKGGYDRAARGLDAGAFTY